GDLIFSELTFTVEHERNSWIRSNPAALKLGSRDSFMHYCIHAPLQQVPKVPCDRGLAAFTCIACLAPFVRFGLHPFRITTSHNGSSWLLSILECCSGLQTQWPGCC